MRETKLKEVIRIIFKPVTSTKKLRPVWMMLLERLVGESALYLYRGNRSRPGREQTYREHTSLSGLRGGGEVTVPWKMRMMATGCMPATLYKENLIYMTGLWTAYPGRDSQARYGAGLLILWCSPPRGFESPSRR